MLSLAACKKETEKEEDPKEELPVFGTCKPVTPVGQLTISTADGKFIFRTKDGGTITVSPQSFVVITHDDYPVFKIELWGDTVVNGQVKTSANHENLNGKHIKDRLGSRRTILFPDGAKVTLVADGEDGPLLSVSIYDGEESHHINPTCNTLEHSSTTASIAQQLDAAEVDGEASEFEFTATGLIWRNLYTEDMPGIKIDGEYPLGEISRDNLNQVIDYFDDLRLGHT